MIEPLHIKLRNRNILVGPNPSPVGDLSPDNQRRYREACSEIPRVKKYVPPFSITAPLVTKGQFFGFLNLVWSTRGVLLDRDREYWDWIHAIEGYDDSLPIVGVSIAEAIMYAHFHGGRLPREEEHFLGVKSLLGDRVVENPSVLDDVPSREEFIAGIRAGVEADRHPLQLFGVVRELVTATRELIGAYESSHLLARSTYTAWNDRFYAAGLSIPESDAYLDGPSKQYPRCWIISPNGFRVIQD